MTPRYSPEITLGNILLALTLLVTAGLLEFPRTSDFKVVQVTVARHEEILKELTSSEQLIAANLQVLTAIVNDRLALNGQVVQPTHSKKANEE